ncbi:MAG: thermonuclease family protein [Spirochaetaceae bacterium]|jgi:micrococcal nuclease|nr:thermonuclease family protein [Spirochaetaceae bacterium]
MKIKKSPWRVWGIVLASLFVLTAADEPVVYVTNSGKKYHLEGCASLARSKIAVTLGDALRSGYGACGVCAPPGSLPADPASASPGGLYRVDQANLTRSGEASLSRMLRAEVVGHIDGDTVRVRIVNPPSELKTVETLRMIGVDTPETVHPNRPVEPFGIEASNFTKERLFGKSVYLAFDWDLRDHYGRLLAYIYPEAGECFNALLIQEGYGYAYPAFPFQFKSEFEALEKAARSAQRGLWGN